ncbi:transmembrane protein, putative (macronuclear) [Tetrahymena thermophila SB210]|uniref:Transmembrane protein, putative n=1 Tax=Tetrahymena thermophila (strain SB210) TaxID=312017 RepID=W7XHX2_TETTS|nr:transmembrane protein, putative [Tetrahymena thermophila SB210]EWS72789.1 transmembrane protein, putative [Tetrahymena thermophila SB210]|eukprot:XP_012654676.1 transmembrane protein, putative [Tetrahymena thermophila SB210]
MPCSTQNQRKYAKIISWLQNKDDYHCASLLYLNYIPLDILSCEGGVLLLKLIESNNSMYFNQIFSIRWYQIIYQLFSKQLCLNQLQFQCASTGQKFNFFLLSHFRFSAKTLYLWLQISSIFNLLFLEILQIALTTLHVFLIQSTTVVVIDQFPFNNQKQNYGRFLISINSATYRKKIDFLAKQVRQKRQNSIIICFIFDRSIQNYFILSHE